MVAIHGGAMEQAACIWLATSLLVKIDPTTSEDNMTSHFQDITKMQFQ